MGMFKARARPVEEMIAEISCEVKDSRVKLCSNKQSRLLRYKICSITS
jgi:hypothetical protein